jgi:hypothetical protein
VLKNERIRQSNGRSVLNFEFRFSPKIMHKGLALFVVPVVLNAVWVVLLIQTLAHSQMLIEQERSHSDNIDHINTAMEKLFNASGGMFSYMFSNDRQYLGNCQNYVQQLRTELEIIAKNNSMSGREYVELTNIADQYDHFLLELKRASATNTSVFVMVLPALVSLHPLSNTCIGSSYLNLQNQGKIRSHRRSCGNLIRSSTQHK